MLRDFADRMAAFYKTRVYLCGSALLDCNATPRDWDIRISLDDDTFMRMFGLPDLWSEQGRTGQWGKVRWRWSDRMVKDSKDGYARTLLNIDFQAYPAKHFRAYRNLPRLRLDRRRT